MLVDFIMKSDSKGFIEYFESVKSKLNQINKNVYNGQIKT
jgi:hypothetical protein